VAPAVEGSTATADETDEQEGRPMSDARPEDGMIEIGDPTAEPGGFEPPPKVVIEYRERGVPWMLIPPLLVLSAVLAAVATSALKPEPGRGPLPIALAPSDAAPAPAVAPAPASAPVPMPVVEPPAPAPVIAPAPLPTVASAPAAPEPVPAPAPPSDPPGPDPRAFPRVQGLGFDAAALAADARPEPPADPAADEAAQGGRPDEPAAADRTIPAIAPDGGDQRAEVDPDVLPPDPRQARQARLRRIAEDKRRAEADRAQFHADLAAICRRSGARSAPLIDELCVRYGTDVDPSVKQDAVKMLGKTGVAAGAARPVRINLLRSLGFPESLILNDLFEIDSRWASKVDRNGPKSREEMVYRSALLLLAYPPRTAATPTPVPATTRPVSSPRPAPNLPLSSYAPTDPGPSR